MATPTLSKHTLPGTLGEILVDVRAGGRESPRPAVLVLHGWKGFKDWGMFPPAAERLAQAGFTAVACNVSGSGVDDLGEFSLPERFGHNTYGAELADVAVVLDALRTGRLGTVPPSSIGILGHSRGGGVAVLQAARDADRDASRVRALVTWAAIAGIDRWSPEARAEWRERGRTDVVNSRTGQILPLYTELLDEIETQAAGALDIEAAARRADIPWLIVHGSRDEAVGVEEARRLKQASPQPTTRLLEVEGGTHTFGAVHPWAGMTPELRRALDASVAWFARYLD